MKNFILALRTLKNYRFYSIVNIVGLAMSLACTIVISRYVYREMTVDTFNSNLDRIHAIVNEQRDDNSRMRLEYPTNPNGESGYVDPLVDPAIVWATQMYCFPKDNLKIDDKEFNADIAAVDSNFMKVFDYQLVRGDRASVLHNASGALITEEFAAKHFPGVDPMGRIMKHSTGKEVVIEGIIASTTSKSLLNFDVLISTMLQQHWSYMSIGFVLATPNTLVEDMNARSGEFMEMKIWNSFQRFQFIPLKGLYFNTTLVSPSGPRSTMLKSGDHSNLMVLSVVALLVLLIGVFNFINIYTVLMLRRSREVGVKKVFGAATSSIIKSLYVENLVMITLAVGLGWVLIKLCGKMIEGWIGIPQVGSWQFDILLSVGIMILLPLLTTVFPYFKYKYAKPITSLREISGGRGSIVSRAVFLVLQYMMTVVMIIVAIYFVRQLNFMVSADMGIDTHNIIQTQFAPHRVAYDIISDKVWEEERERDRRNVKYVTEQLNSSPLFEQWTPGEAPLQLGRSGSSFSVAGGEFKQLKTIYVTTTWMKMFGIKHLDGDTYNDSIHRFAQYKLLATPAALKLLGVTDFRAAVVQPERRLWWSAQTREESELMKQNPPFEIIGVVDDFRTEHLSKAALPIVLLYESADFDRVDGANFLIRLTKGREMEAIDFLRKLKSEIYGGEFTYTFVEDQVRDMYTEDKRVAIIYTTFAIIAILISSLGLFSLSLYDVQQRYREIALRRVNGASVRQIVTMLLRKYYLLLGIAFVIAMPLAWWAIDWYMQDFASKAPLSLWIFILAALITAAISLLTLIYQTIRAALTNPAIAMKTE